MSIPPPVVGHAIIEGVRLVDRMERRRLGFTFHATSLPGHLIQFMDTGHVRQEMNGRRYELKPGDVAWYHEDELVRGEVIEAPWAFFTVNFVAPSLPPPPFDRRVVASTAQMRRGFATLLRTWRDTSVQPSARAMRVHAALLSILADLAEPLAEPFTTTQATELWWQLETSVRGQLQRRIMLGDLENMSGRSIATIARSCHIATGMSPMKRLHQVRLSLAQGLLRHSELTVSEIASRIGYGRIHEFSRDYRKWRGMPPTHERNAHRT